MILKEYMNISEFAKISGTTRRNLLFYDEIGLFSPATVGDNGYRYYTMQQFYILDIINILKAVGMPLKKINEFLHTRTPQKSIELFSEQAQEISAEIEKLTYYHQALQTRIWRINQTASFDLNKLILEKSPSEYFLASEKVKNVEDSNMIKAYFSFFSTLHRQRLNIGYPMGGVIYSSDGLFDSNIVYEYQMLQKISKKEVQKYKGYYIVKKPAGYYLTGFRYGEQGRTEILPDKMREYITENNIQTTGPLWEFWWQDDTVTQEPDKHICQTFVRIKNYVN